LRATALGIGAVLEYHQSGRHSSAQGPGVVHGPGGDLPFVLLPSYRTLRPGGVNITIEFSDGFRSRVTEETCGSVVQLMMTPVDPY
jgi:hypothetical protein